jgi:hypothetical protein
MAPARTPPSAVGCQGSTQATAPAEPEPVESDDVGSLPRWVQSRLTKSDGSMLGLVFGSSDHAVGRNRVSFLIVRGDNSLVQAPEADVYVGRAGAQEARSFRALLIPIGPHLHPRGTGAHDHPDATDVYVANLDFTRPGRYWVVVEAIGETAHAAAMLAVARKPITPAVGSKAIPSRNPTVRSAPATEITTAMPPDTQLLRYSVAQSLRERAPFVVAFATPALCQSQICGPVVDVVEQVRKRFARTRVRFIHVEIFERNDPAQGFNRWVREWRLPSEPWVFVVDGRGIIRAKFEGAVSVEELVAAVEPVAG